MVYAASADKPTEGKRHRNGASGKTVLTEDGPLRIEVPLDRSGSFEPLLIPKHERRFTGFDDKIVAIYARGMTVREIQGFLAEHYGTEVSPDLISSVSQRMTLRVKQGNGGKEASCMWSRRKKGVRGDSQKSTPEMHLPLRAQFPSNSTARFDGITN